MSNKINVNIKNVCKLTNGKYRLIDGVDASTSSIDDTTYYGIVGDGEYTDSFKHYKPVDGCSLDDDEEHEYLI